MSPDYAGADVVLVNTCGFLDSAKEESLEAIGEAIAENGRVVVTGCMGNEADVIRQRFPDVLAVTGPQQYEEVVSAVHDAAPPAASPYHRPGARSGPEAHAAALQLFEDLRGLQSPLQLLHHPKHSRRSRQPTSRRRPPRGGEAGRSGHEGTAGHQPGHVGLWRRHPPPAAHVEGRRGPRPHDRPGPRARQARRLGAPALRLPLPARRPGHPADGRGAGPPLPRHSVPAREPESAPFDEAARPTKPRSWSG